MRGWTQEAIDAATRVICCAGRGLCLAPNCDCWEQGREITRAALDAASKHQALAEKLPTEDPIRGGELT